MRESTLFYLCLPILVSAQFGDLNKYDSDAEVDPKTALEKWTLMESRIKDFSEEAVKIILAKLLETTGSANISSTCIKNTMTIINGLKKMKTWAFKFLDASAKSVDGMLGGTVTSIGHFDECLNNKVINERSGKHKGEVIFRGMYCRIEIRPYLPPKPPVVKFSERLELFRNFSKKDTILGFMANFSHLMYNRGLSTAMCAPTGCSVHDINQLLQPAGDYIGMVIKAKRCEIKEENKYTARTIFVITLYSFILLLVLTSTSVNLYFMYRNREIKDNRSKIVTSFSIISNFEKFTDSSSSSKLFSCLNGIRFLTMAWIILSHTYLALALEIQGIPENREAVIGEFTFQAILNGTYSIETFFVMGGMLVCYSMTKVMKFGKKPFNFFLYLFHRIWRLYPCYIVILLFVFLLPLLGSGPIFHEVNDYFIESCNRNWWANLLAINNFYDFRNACLPHTYYIALDIQFYIGFLVVLLPLMKWPKIGIGLAVAVIFASMILSAVQTYVYDLPVAQLVTPDFGDQERYMKYLSYTPIAHSGPFSIGVLIGYLLAVRPTFKIPKSVQVVGWSLALVFPMCVVNGVQKWNSGVDPTFWETMLYTSCCRVAFACAVAWVIVCCASGNGGIVNFILSWKIWIPLGRLTFLAFLIHPYVLMLYVGTMRTPFYYLNPPIVWQFFGHLLVTYLLSFGVTLVIEGPFLGLEKIMFSKQGHKLKSSPPQETKGTEEEPTLPGQNDMITILNLKNKASDGNGGVANGSFVYKL